MYKHTIERYSALKWKDILTPVPTRRNLEDTVLSEVSWSQKDKYCVITSQEVPGGVTSIGTGSGWWGQGLGGGGEASVERGLSFSWGDEKFWRWMVLMVVQQCECA